MSSIQLFEAVHFKTDCNLEFRDRIQKEKVYCMKKVNVCFFFLFSSRRYVNCNVLNYGNVGVPVVYGICCGRLK